MREMEPYLTELFETLQSLQRINNEQLDTDNTGDCPVVAVEPLARFILSKFGLARFGLVGINILREEAAINQSKGCS